MTSPQAVYLSVAIRFQNRITQPMSTPRLTLAADCLPCVGTAAHAIERSPHPAAAQQPPQTGNQLLKELLYL